MKGTDAFPVSGKILFQSEGAEVFFRDITLYPLEVAVGQRLIGARCSTRTRARRGATSCWWTTCGSAGMGRAIRAGKLLHPHEGWVVAVDTGLGLAGVEACSATKPLSGNPVFRPSCRTWTHERHKSGMATSRPSDVV